MKSACDSSRLTKININERSSISKKLPIETLMETEFLKKLKMNLETNHTKVQISAVLANRLPDPKKGTLSNFLPIERYWSKVKTKQPVTTRIFSAFQLC